MPQSYFALLDLDPRFALPADLLDRAYRRMAARVHPDHQAGLGDAERRQVLSAAADVNEAYSTLRSAARRALHLLRIRGIEADGAQTLVSPGFLAEQMQWQETLAEAKATRDPAALRALQRTVRDHTDALCTRLENQLDVLRDDAAAARGAQELLFLEKLDARIDDARTELED